MEDETADVLVLGAGAAGLAAAQQLSQEGLRVIVIEARNRVGGRIFTQHVSGHPLPIELGAEFIHGRPPESFALVEQAGLLVYEINGATRCGSKPSNSLRRWRQRVMWTARFKHSSPASRAILLGVTLRRWRRAMWKGLMLPTSAL